MKLRHGIAIVAALGLILATGCAGGGGSGSPGGGPPPPPPPPTGSAWAGHYTGSFAGDSFAHSGTLDVRVSSTGAVSGQISFSPSPATGYNVSGSISTNGTLNVRYVAGGVPYHTTGTIAQDASGHYVGTLTTTNESSGGSSTARVDLTKG